MSGLSYRITVPANVPASLNRVMRWNPQRKKREREMWERTIFVLLGQRAAADLRRHARFGEKMWARVTICNPRRYDTDNAHGACKIVFDAIRNLGLVKDDREEFLSQLVEQRKASGKDKCTIIEIGPIDKREAL